MKIDPKLARRLVETRLHDPFALLGRFDANGYSVVRVYRPDAVAVRLESGRPLESTTWPGLFQVVLPTNDIAHGDRIYWVDAAQHEHIDRDAYQFPAVSTLSTHDLYLFNQGRLRYAYDLLGAHAHEVGGVRGVRFSVWAPNGERVSVVGDFNHWDGRWHPMQIQGTSGVWSLFVPDVATGARYKFEIRSRRDGRVMLKADPYARAAELRPRTASVVASADAFPWTDAAWLAQRTAANPLATPISIYEVHLGSWRRDRQGNMLSYRQLAVQLADHVAALGFTHVELLPITEHPFDASWGYQSLGYFAPTSRFGSPDEFRAFVDYLHGRGIGVILDWSPAHFPDDTHGLACFDGTSLYEHADPRRGVHREWDTLIFDYGRPEVRNFLTASALFWLKEMHLDGLRVDAVASMLYLDYSRETGDWAPNVHGGNANLEAIDWLKELNIVTHGECPGVLVIAEESTTWPRVTRPTDVGGLGFTLKWNMGWMNDTLCYMRLDSVHRAFHHHRLTFGMLYAYTENFVMPLSHDEVVHGKAALLSKMPGDDWQKFANLRLLYTYMFTFPGKKLLFMGAELAQRKEWNHDTELDWSLLAHPIHRGVCDLLTVLNALYRHEPAFRLDHDPIGFEWIDCDDAANSVISYIRRNGSSSIAVLLNFTPVVREGYRLGVPAAGRYRLLLNSDAVDFGGSGVGGPMVVESESTPWMGRAFSLHVTLPPLGGLVISLDRCA